MARFQRLEIYQSLKQNGLLALFYHSEISKALTAARAAQDAGLQALEFTHRGDAALGVFTSLLHELPTLMLGVGSIVDAPTAAQYINLGANFVVGPCFNEDIARLCNRRKVAYLPGCATLTEIGEAETAGCEIIKIFPAKECGGPGFIKAVLGPSPWSSLMPTGGVELEQAALKAWFDAGAVCVGLGSNLMESALVNSGDASALRKRCEQARELVAHARGLKP